MQDKLSTGKPVKLSTIAAALLIGLCAPAWAVNKCTGSAGKVSYQDAPCTDKGEKIELQPNSGLVLPKGAQAKSSTAAVAPPASVLPPSMALPQNPVKSALEQEADACMGWYKPKLRDPASAYYTDRSKEGRVVSILIHGTNGYGGYTLKEATCEIHNGRLDADWTKIHAKRSGWYVD
jgi:hypothetical protein